MNQTQTDTTSCSYVAIDLAKKSLHAHCEADQRRFAYTEEGLKQLLAWATRRGGAHFVCEATGGYERTLLRFCWERGLAVSLVNPERVRAFAKSEGRRAKTDKLDAAVLLRFAQARQPRALAEPEPAQQAMSVLLDRRAQLSATLAREKNRLEKEPELACVVEDIQSMITELQSRLARLDREIKKTIKSSPAMQERETLMRSVKGVGPQTAWTLLAYLSEIAEPNLKRNELVALAGLAPYNRDSGSTQGRRFIQGGRAKIRRCLFMAARSAATHNPVIRDYVARLCQRGKPYKCALVAAMRKILLHLRALIKKQEFNLA